MKRSWQARLWQRIRDIEILPVLIVGGGLAFIVMCILLYQRDMRQWERFKGQHRCVVVRIIDGTTSVGVVDGKLVTATSGNRVVYRCDDGIEYEKEE